MPLFTPEQYREFLRTHEPTPTYVDRLLNEAKDMLRLWIEALGEESLHLYCQREGILQPTQEQIKAVFLVYLDCVKRRNSMINHLSKRHEK
jgi:hypothetical protein